MFDESRLKKRFNPYVTQVTLRAKCKEMAMNLGALALLVHGGTENWSPQRWKNRFDDVCPNRRVLLLPDATFDPSEVHYAAV